MPSRARTRRPRRPARPPRRRGGTSPGSIDNVISGQDTDTKVTFERDVTALRQKEVLESPEVGILMIAAGFPKDETVIAEGISIVACESTFRRAATSPGVRAMGIWQINPNAHGENEKCWRDNLCASRKAKSLYNAAGKKWTDWVCPPNPDQYRTAAKAALSESGNISANDLSNPITDLIDDPLEQIARVIEGIAKFFIGLGELLLTPEGWLRLGKLIGGSILVLWGLAKLAGAGGAAKSAARAVPVARAAKAVT